jgi:hypothetical protein
MKRKPEPSFSIVLRIAVLITCRSNDALYAPACRYLLIRFIRGSRGGQVC